MTKKVSLDLKKRLSKEDALDLIKNASLLDLAKMASAKKDELHKEKLTTFIVDRNINYTNVCWVDCKFCAFFRHKKDNNQFSNLDELHLEKVFEFHQLQFTVFHLLKLIL